LISHARAKLEQKHLDLIVANPVPQTFGSDRVQAILLKASGEDIQLEPLSKERLADIILDQIEQLLA
jgi:phosphopantothenoylcysteine decarboxylase / phosphopantothenate---cysteine ligase